MGKSQVENTCFQIKASGPTGSRVFSLRISHDQFYPWATIRINLVSEHKEMHNVNSKASGKGSEDDFSNIFSYVFQTDS